MDIKDLVKNIFPITEISPNMYEIKTSIHIASSMFLTLHLEKLENGYRLTDNKKIATFLQHIFDFKATDVQSCLKAVFQANSINFSKGELFVILPNDVNFSRRFMDYIVCAGQLIRMYAFFDKP